MAFLLETSCLPLHVNFAPCSVPMSLKCMTSGLWLDLANERYFGKPEGSQKYKLKKIFL